MTLTEYDQTLTEELGSYYDDPYGFVMRAYPWGIKGTDLEHELVLNCVN
jgi:hypothetical protein